mmetsp:Transcript_21986/g.46530  ORF Transcript_21986/g.46530 Transcript_21986/m.46530 type:complete len:99 (+) Transcript_21986:1100-1396(+)
MTFWRPVEGTAILIWSRQVRAVVAMDYGVGWVDIGWMFHSELGVRGEYSKFETNIVSGNESTFKIKSIIHCQWPKTVACRLRSSLKTLQYFELVSSSV